MIAWRYLNKQGATVSALRDYRLMAEIVQITPDEIKSVHDSICSPRGSILTGMPRTKNAHAGESALCHAFDKIEIMRERYRQALEFLEWFEPAWACIQESDQLLLTEFYIKDQPAASAYEALSAMLRYDERHIRRLKGQAVEKLSAVLYGK